MSMVCVDRLATAHHDLTIAVLVADMANYMTLLPGDLIPTGTPPGVGWE